jgi:proteasome assembly chaperone (PAC2) family protein
MAARGSKHIELLVPQLPALDDAVLVAGFQGWNDGGQAATAGVRWLARHLDGERFAGVRPDDFHVFTEMESRPIARRHGNQRVIRWPRHDFFAIRRKPGWRRDLVALVAREPNLRWRTYCDEVMETARQAGVRQVVTLGAFLAAVPHTRPVPVVGYSWDDDLSATLSSMGTLSTTYEGPTGIVSVLADAARSSGLHAASLWAAVPHYLPTTANPKAALALLRALRDLVDLPLDLARLEDAAAFFEAQVSEAVRAKDEVAEHVHELEAKSEEDQRGRSQGPDLPNADDVIKAFEEMLRRGRSEDQES